MTNSTSEMKIISFNGRDVLVRLRQHPEGIGMEVAELPSALVWRSLTAVPKPEPDPEIFVGKIQPRWSSIQRELLELMPQPDGSVHSTIDGSVVGWWSPEPNDRIAVSLVLDASVGPLGVVK